MQFGGESSSQRKGGSSNPQRRRLDPKDLPSVRRLGKGLSGFLYKTTWEGNKYVRKDFPLGSVHHNVFEKEAIALLDLDHPNIVRCPHYTVGKSSCSLLLEYVDDDLQNIIQKKIEAQGKGNRTGSSTTLHSRVLDIDETRSLMASKAKQREITGADVGLMKMPENEPTAAFEVPEAVAIIFEIATGIKYLHDNGIVHGDLKPKNLLVGCDGIVKLVDFGLVETKKRIKLVSKRTRHFEILMWKAPERFAKLLGPVTEYSDDPFTDSDTDSDEEIESSVIFTESRLAMADVYSFGLICAQILGGKLMYSNLSLTQLREQRMHGFRPQLPSTCPDGLQSLIFSSVERDPRCRPTVSEICTALKAFQTNKRPRLMEVEGEKALSMSMDVLPDELLRPVLSKHSQHGFELSQFGVERPRPGLEEQMAVSFGNMLLETPSASPHPHPHPHPWDDQPFLNPVDPLSVQHRYEPPVSECFSGELNSSWRHLESEDTIGSHATQQTTQWYGGMAVMTGETGDESRDNLVDTAGTSTMLPYILPPLAEEKSLVSWPFYKVYKDFRAIARGKEVAFGSARRGRRIRVLVMAFCFALRCRTKTAMRKKWKKAERLRIREPATSVDIAGTSTMLPYNLPPLAEEKSLVSWPSYEVYEDFRAIARGEEVAFGTARRGRRIRVLVMAFCFALRLRTKMAMRKKWKKAERQRIREPATSVDIAGISTMLPYILPPLAEEKSLVLWPSYEVYEDYRAIARGEYEDFRAIARGEEVAFGSARRGRRIRVLVMAFCFALRLRTKTAMRKKRKKAEKPRIREPATFVDIAGTSTMSPYILPSLVEEKSVVSWPSYEVYKDFRAIARGEEVAFGTARRGRRIRVLVMAFCFALRLRTKMAMRKKWKKAERQRIWEPQHQQKLYQQSMKRIRTGVPTPPARGSSNRSSTDRLYTPERQLEREGPSEHLQRGVDLDILPREGDAAGQEAGQEAGEEIGGRTLTRTPSGTRRST